MDEEDQLRNKLLWRTTVPVGLLAAIFAGIFTGMSLGPVMGFVGGLAYAAIIGGALLLLNRRAKICLKDPPDKLQSGESFLRSPE